MSALKWVVVGGGVAALALWLELKKDYPSSLLRSSITWTCKPGHECMKWFADNSWHDDDLEQKTLAIYSTPPTNFSDLVPIRTYPEYVVFTVKPGSVGQHPGSFLIPR